MKRSTYQFPTGLMAQLGALSSSIVSPNYPPLPEEGVGKWAKNIEVDATMRASSDPDFPVELYRNLRSVCALFSKNASADATLTPAIRRSTALQTFENVELKNRISRDDVQKFCGCHNLLEVPRQVLAEAQSDIYRLLGDSPDEALWEEASRAAVVFSSGSIQGLAKLRSGVTDVNAYAKLLKETEATITRKCAAVFGGILFVGPYAEAWAQQDVVFSEYSRVTTVPKDAITDRVIAVEPMGNAMAQQMMRFMLEKKLKQWHIDLADQTRNQQLARKGSILGFSEDGLATLDLKSASDHITDPLVSYLVPPGWKYFFDASRTEWLELDGEVFPSFLYMTMGNAFTFALQTLIFSSLARASARVANCSLDDVTAYGDDIIVPVPAALLLTEVLNLCGLRVNITKSHIIGSFRESCGADWLCGEFVRPAYLRDAVTMTDFISYFNNAQRRRCPESLLSLMVEVGVKFGCPVGPVLHPSSPSESHMEAPIHFLRRYRKCRIEWDHGVQSYKYSYVCLITGNRKRLRRAVFPRYLCALLGDPAVRHDLRGVETDTRLGVKVTTTPYVAALASLAWYTPGLAQS